MFLPNTDCWITAQTLEADIYGRRIEGARRHERCGVVKLLVENGKTSVRADSSASRGNADEYVADAVLLFPATSQVQYGEKVEIAGFELKVSGVFPRFTVQGVLDHYQVELMTWA